MKLLLALVSVLAVVIDVSDLKVNDIKLFQAKIILAKREHRPVDHIISDIQRLQAERKNDKRILRLAEKLPPISLGVSVRQAGNRLYRSDTLMQRIIGNDLPILPQALPLNIKEKVGVEKLFIGVE